MQLTQTYRVLKAVCEGFKEDPGTSDLDDKQPITVSIPLGEYRRAKRLLFEMEVKQ